MGDEKDSIMETTKGEATTYVRRDRIGYASDGTTDFKTIDKVAFAVSGKIIDVAQNPDDNRLIILVDRGNEWATGVIYQHQMEQARRECKAITEWNFGTYHGDLGSAVRTMNRRATGMRAAKAIEGSGVEAMIKLSPSCDSELGSPVVGSADAADAKGDTLCAMIKWQSEKLRGAAEYIQAHGGYGLPYLTELRRCADDGDKAVARFRARLSPKN